MLAIFGSGFLVMLSSLAGYFVEKHKYLTKYNAVIRAFLVQVLHIERYFSLTNPSSEEVFRTVLQINSSYNAFSLEYDNGIDYYFCLKGKSRMNMQSLQALINILHQKLRRVQNEARIASENRTIDYQYNSDIDVNDIADISNKLIDIMNPRYKKEELEVI